MAGETTSTSIATLYTKKVKTKGTYRVYKPKPLKMPRKKKWENQSWKIKDQKDEANQNPLIKNLKLINLQDDLLGKNSARNLASLKTFT